MPPFFLYTANQTFLPPPSSPDTHTANLSYPALTTDILIGTCSSKYYLPSGCVLAVTSTWYKDGELFEPTLQLYSQSLSEAVTILSLTEQTVGYYVCVTELPYGLGSYRTVDVAIAISTPGELDDNKHPFSLSSYVLVTFLHSAFSLTITDYHIPCLY